MLYNLIEELRRKEYVLIRVLRTLSNPNILDLTDLWSPQRSPIQTLPPCPSLKSNHSLKSVSFFLRGFQFELLFCIQEEDDSRLRMYVESLRAKFPKVDCQVRNEGMEEGRRTKAKAKGKQMQCHDARIHDPLPSTVSLSENDILLCIRSIIVADVPTKSGLFSTIENSGYAAICYF